MKTIDLVSLSLRTIRCNRLRSGITISIIALGITALIGIITAIQAMNQKMTESFSAMGANGFTIRAKERAFRLGRQQKEVTVSKKGQKQVKKSNLGQPITMQEAEAFKETFYYPAQVGLSCSAGNIYSISTNNKRTNPNVSVFGGDENNVELNGNTIQYGRNFTPKEVGEGIEVCILGNDVAQNLFGQNPSIGKEVRIRNLSYRVIAVLESKGSTFGFSRDNIAVIPYKSLVRNFQYGSFSIGVKTEHATRVEEAMGEAEGVYRNVRRLAITEERNFILERSDNLSQKAINSLRYIAAAVTIIGFITLIGAAIGLMNIMLVAVAERTKEIGLLKAIGAKKSTIRMQFLSEALLISLAGSIIGILFGILLGNLFCIVLETNFVVPLNWMLYGIIICTIVGLAAGSYPALKAGALNPIKALRYE